MDFPRRPFETGRDDYELYEEDGEFVLSVELPGFDPAGIDVTWREGVLNVVAEHDDEARGRRKTYHRRFPFPNDADDEITAEYRNGILEVGLPVHEGVTARGTAIEDQG
ncbi:MAG: Hsp20/alpha crystallin family protein [Halosimplex sp.]